MKQRLYHAAIKKFEADRDSAIAILSVYLNQAVGIGEHPDLVESVEAQVDKYVHALEMVEGVDKILNESLPSTERKWKDYEHLP